jgi:multidrug efflux pump subunit AcrB
VAEEDISIDQRIQIGGQVTKSLYQFFMQTPDRPKLYADADKLAKAVEESVPGVEDVTTDVAVSTPQVNVTMDRDPEFVSPGKPPQSHLCRHRFPRIS